MHSVAAAGAKVSFILIDVDQQDNHQQRRQNAQENNESSDDNEQQDEEEHTSLIKGNASRNGDNEDA